MATKIFINLPVADLQKAANIFRQQGDNQNYQQTQAIIEQFNK